MTARAAEVINCAAVPPPAPTVSHRVLTLGLCTAVVAIAFESISVATAMPEAARELDGLSLYAWAFSLFLIGMLFATVAAGRLADRVGPARPVMIGIALFSVGLVVAATSRSMVQLMGARLVQGLGCGTLGVAAYVCIARVFEPSQRPTVFSYISTAWVVPSFVGPPVAAFLTHRLGWPWVFLAVLPLVGLAALMVLPSLPLMRGPSHEEGPPSTREPAALWAAALAALGTAALQLAGQLEDWRGLPCAALGLALLGTSLPNLMPARFFRLSQGTPAVIGVRGLLAGAFFGAESFIPLMLVEQRGLSLLRAGGVLTVGVLGWTAGSWLQSRTWIALRRDRIITLGSACILLGLALAALTVGGPDVWVGLLVLGWTVSGLGMGLAMASTSLAVMTESALAEQGRNAASLQLGEALGSSLFIGLAGSLFNRLHTGAHPAGAFGAVLGTMTAVALLGLGLSWRIGRLRDAPGSG